jgi:glycerate kinase
VKIVVASDSFKDSLTSLEVATAASAGIRAVLPEAEVIALNVADGGEGTVRTMIDTLGGDLVTALVFDPLGRPITAQYGIAGTTAIIEMASASGLPLLRAEERDPWMTSTYGTGEMIMDAIGRGCRNFLVGIGGSATNDAGTGMLQAMGFRFYDAEGERIEHCAGGRMQDIARIDDSQVPEAVRQSLFTVACDVDTPFCGPEGAAPVFAPQKGADATMVERLDAGMASLAKVIEATYGVDVVPVAGAGAAGGMGGAFYAFLQATLKKGIDMVLDAIDFDATIEGADLVITGEGKVDFQTLTGKTPFGVAKRARKQGIPVIAIGGCVQINKEEAVEAGFEDVYQVTPPGMSLQEAMKLDVASENVYQTTLKILSRYE